MEASAHRPYTLPGEKGHLSLPTTGGARSPVTCDLHITAKLSCQGGERGGQMLGPRSDAHGRQEG